MIEYPNHLKSPARTNAVSPGRVAAAGTKDRDDDDDVQEDSPAALRQEAVSVESRNSRESVRGMKKDMKEAMRLARVILGGETVSHLNDSSHGSLSSGSLGSDYSNNGSLGRNTPKGKRNKSHRRTFLYAIREAASMKQRIRALERERSLLRRAVRQSWRLRGSSDGVDSVGSSVSHRTDASDSSSSLLSDADRDVQVRLACWTTAFRNVNATYDRLLRRCHDDLRKVNKTLLRQSVVATAAAAYDSSPVPPSIGSNRTLPIDLDTHPIAVPVNDAPLPPANDSIHDIDDLVGTVLSFPSSTRLQQTEQQLQDAQRMNRVKDQRIAQLEQQLRRMELSQGHSQTAVLLPDRTPTVSPTNAATAAVASVSTMTASDKLDSHHASSLRLSTPTETVDLSVMSSSPPRPEERRAINVPTIDVTNDDLLIFDNASEGSSIDSEDPAETTQASTPSALAEKSAPIPAKDAVTATALFTQ